MKGLLKVLFASLLFAVIAGVSVSSSAVVHNKAPGTELLKQTTDLQSAEFIAVNYQADFRTESGQLEKQNNSELKIELGIKEQTKSFVKIRPPILRCTDDYLISKTDFKLSSNRWKDFHRRMWGES